LENGLYQYSFSNAGKNGLGDLDQLLEQSTCTNVHNIYCFTCIWNITLL